MKRRAYVGAVLSTSMSLTRRALLALVGSLPFAKGLVGTMPAHSAPPPFILLPDPKPEIGTYAAIDRATFSFWRDSQRPA